METRAHTLTPDTAPPTRETPLAPELQLVLEQFEAEVWESMLAAETGGAGDAAAPRAARMGSAAMLSAPAIDVLALNRVVGLGIGAPASESLLDEVIARYAGDGVARFFVQLSPYAQPPALAEWLRARGFVHHNNWVKLYRGSDNPPRVESDLRVEQIGPDHAATFAAITAPAFDWPDAMLASMARLVGRPGWRTYLAFDGATPIAAAALYVSGARAYFGPAATLASYRGRGGQAALIARRMRDAAGLGCTLFVSETAEDRPDRDAPSFRNLRRFGFEVAYVRPNYLLRLTPA